MAYSEEADLSLSETRKIELTESEDAIGEKDAALITRLQARATARINAALFGKYAIPDDDFPPILTHIEVDLWKFYLYEYREVMTVPPSVERAYTAALALLERYRTGEELLDCARVSATTEPATTAGLFSDDTDERVFGRAKDFV